MILSAERKSDQRVRASSLMRGFLDPTRLDEDVAAPPSRSIGPGREFGHREIAGARHIGKKLGPSGSLSSVVASNPCFK